MRGFLRTPVGWFALVFAECAAVLLVARELLGRYPEDRSTIGWVILALAVLVTIANYVRRRRYLSER